MTSLHDELLRRNNFHTSSTRCWEAISGIGWHEPTPSGLPLAAVRTLSVVVPAHNVGYCLAAVLDALEGQHHQYRFEVIVIDDASTDTTAAIAAQHPIVTTVLRLPEQMGGATARNLGAAVARGQTVLYLDADMVLPPHVITDIAARATDTTVLVGFRHNLRYDLHQGGRGVLADHPLRREVRSDSRLPVNASTSRSDTKPPTAESSRHRAVLLLLAPVPRLLSNVRSGVLDVSQEREPVRAVTRR
jgi:hypothetical protein